MRAKGERDLRHPARQQVDQAWSRATEYVERRFGRALPLELHDQPSRETEILLRQAREAEGLYLSLAVSAAARPAAVEDAFQAFCGRVADYLNLLSANWPSAREHRAQQKKEQEWWLK